ncbi:piRNA biogenesis protein EXD1-like [Anoplophora glabripennis]|uniref:piRNA biogenesis protein EXD1-like n=1 Tax=Anoplophora glabripennis TaxID=217634 RepID=UPI00087362CC|nr:piRNA biogenesis protein EXD1-like [Anoplophora glabripennis]
MEDSYNSLYQIGDHLMIELNTQEIFEGDYSDGGKNRIDLVNVRQHNNTNKLEGVYSFYRNEIIKIYKHKSAVLKEDEKNKVIVTESNNIQIVEEEYNRLKQMCKDAIYLEQIDDRYFKSVEKLSEAETVGVVSLGTDESTIDTLRLLVMCTWKQIYLFDLVSFRHRKFYPEIKNILESEYVTKVMHGGSSLINILYNNYNVYVQNTFDTQIVDLILEKSETRTCPKFTADISQCLVKYLNFPPSLLKDALSVSKRNWKERPLTEEQRFFASQLVTYLIPLKDHMSKKLMYKVYKAMDDVHNLYFSLDNYAFSHIMQKNKVTKEISNLIPTLSSTLNLKNEHKDNSD